MSNETSTTEGWKKWVVLVAVCGALLLDNMLYMVVVPIMSSILSDLDSKSTLSNPVKLVLLNNCNQTVSTVNKTNLCDTVDITVSSASELLMKFPKDNNSSKMRAQTEHGNKSGQTLCVQNKTIHADENTTNINFRIFSTNVTHHAKRRMRLDIRTGFLFAFKALVQVLIGPITGTIIDRTGFVSPMIFGLVLLVFSTLSFAWASSYVMLLVARGVQGVGSSFADTSGLAMLCSQYSSESERARVLGIALACISFGSVIGPPFGGFFYDYVSHSAPFYFLTGLVIVDLLLVLLLARSQISKDSKSTSSTSICCLVTDPFIVVCALALIMSNVSLAFIEPTIARWMKATMNASEFEIGMIWLSPFLPHLFGVILTVKLITMFPRHPWLVAMIGLTIEGFSCLFLPLCGSVATITLPIIINCFGIALVDTAILPVLAFIMDTRYTSVYGSVYAIADISYSLAFAFGPIVADLIYHNLGFMGLNVTICISSVLYAPVLLSLSLLYKSQQSTGQNGTYGSGNNNEYESLNNSNPVESSSLVSKRCIDSNRYCTLTNESR